ncbi:TPA: phage tail protein [Salmonella enterica subsp. enterica serovar Newport]
MAQSAITSAFENYKAMEAANGRKVVINSCVLANIPDPDMEKGPQPDEAMPDESLIVHRQAVTRAAMVNADTVTYTVTLDESAGNFTFNWLALMCGDGDTPALIMYLEPQKKIRTAGGKQGNVLTYSCLMEYAGASVQTDITTPASTWQIDFSRRLSGMDDLIRQNAMELYGEALFFDDAFKISTGATADTLTMQTGTAYVRGVRVTSIRPADITLPADRTEDLTVSLNVVFQGNVTGEHRAKYTLISRVAPDYTDTLNIPHFVQPLARIAPDGTVTDLRLTGKTASDQLQGDFLEVSQNLAEIARNGADAQLMARGNLNLGNSATRDMGTTEGTVAAGDDIRITGAMQKDQNGADILNKTEFVDNVGLSETVEKAANAVPSGRKVNGHPLTGDITLTANDTGALSLYGTAVAANKLSTARRINGALFDGTRDIAISAGNVDAYTKGESDGRYVQRMQRGAQGSVFPPHNQTTEVPDGCVMTGVGLSYDGSTGTHVVNLLYRPLQIWINGWRFIEG